jgi:hypothetical protein
MSNIIKDTETLCVKVRTGLDRALIKLRQLKTVESVRGLAEEFRDREHALKMKSVQRALGDELEEAKLKHQQLWVLLDRRIEELREMQQTPAAKKAIYEAASVPPKRIPVIQSAAHIPMGHVESYLAAKARERSVPRSEELATLNQLPAPAQVRAFAKIEDIASAEKLKPHTKTVSQVVKHEEQKALKTWQPTPGKVAPKTSEEDMASTALASLTRQMQQRLSEIFKILPHFKGEKTKTQMDITKKQLAQQLRDCNAKWVELHEIGKKLCQ